MSIRVLQVPHPTTFGREESGIRRVVTAYARYLPAYDIDMVPPNSFTYDLKVVHAGTAPDADIAVCHGLYWTADLEAEAWEFRANQAVITSLRHAKEVTVPSSWVAETLQRDMRLQPHVIGHGIDWADWQEPVDNGGYVLWNKNRAADVCSPAPLGPLAHTHPNVQFVTTFAPPQAPSNVQVIGVVAHENMKRLVQGAGVYLSTTKETFGIGTLEALAAGVPVLGFAHGGNLDLVQHGVNGYLARPGDDADLAAGLAYCQEHRAVLAANARECARAWTWERVCEQVAAVYRLALYEEEPTCAIIIPAYNYADKVGRAIESAVQQTYPLLTDIVVVDDGSDDNGATGQVVAEWAAKDRRVRYIRQNNQGVAHARNNGIAAVNTKYVSCLDADDKMAPLFLERCIAPLQRDRSLGIAYTGLHYVKPDGSEGDSPWPGAFDYNLQLQRQNQVPTCCVFRRLMWARLGGYSQRFAPAGAGAEDAEFWLRCGAYGWGAVKATEEPLFIYSWLSGRVSGAKDYQEMDWLGWHPWTRDGAHPFASLATPGRWSHRVRQYDQPHVSVIIPVGPGHEREFVNVLDSLEAQTERKWEAIVAWDSPVPVPEDIKIAYPYVHWTQTKAGGKQGAGAARNAGRKLARAPFLLFVDADDWLYPQALEALLNTWTIDGPAIVYSDYVGKAIISQVEALAPELQQRIIARNVSTGDTVIQYQAFAYDCERAQRQPERPEPYIWCNVTALVPTAWHDEIGGFDEAMPSWEDVDYWYRMARRGKCFVKNDDTLLVYRFYTGGRRDAGLAQHVDLIAYMEHKYAEEGAIMPCPGCGKKTAGRPAPAAPSYPAEMMQRVTNTQRSATEVSAVQDGDFSECRYMHPNRGDHRVIGTAAFPERLPMNMVKRRGAWFIDYGYRAGGGSETFLVHREDARLSPHLYVPVDTPPAAVVVPAPTMPAPTTVTPARPVPLPVPEVSPTGSPPTAVASPPAPPIPVVKRGLTEPLDLQSVPGVTADIAAQMMAAGIATLADLLRETEASLQRFKGVGQKRAEFIARGAADKAKGLS